MALLKRIFNRLKILNWKARFLQSTLPLKSLSFSSSLSFSLSTARKKYLMKSWTSNKYVIPLRIGKSVCWIFYLWLLMVGWDSRWASEAEERNIIKMCPSQYDCWIWNYTAHFPSISAVELYICGFWFAYITVSLDLMVFYSGG